MVDGVDAALADAAAVRDAGADLVEYRVDRLFSGEDDDSGRADVARLVHESALPCIVTCRAADEGGEYDGDDAARVSLYEWLSTGAGTGQAEAVPRYIDVEHATLARSANLRQKIRLAVSHPNQPRDLGTGLILSAHSFDTRPPDLFKRLGDMRGEDAASVIKIAYRARSLRDNLELFDILRERDRPTIALGMGEFGLMSRVLAGKFGGFLTFAALRASEGTAPGQPTLEELVGKFRFRSIGPRTRMYGVIGWPVQHSASPAFHNAAFEHVGHDGVYLPLPVPPEWEHFKATVLALLDAPGLDFAGASVTMPHKEHLLRLAWEDQSRRWTVDPLVEAAGAANTLVVGDDGACRVVNTDGPAVMGLLAGEFNGSLAGQRVGVLGAGGVARAAVAALVGGGADVVVFNRTRVRADELVASLREALGIMPDRLAAKAWERRFEADQIRAWVNATSMGMAGSEAAEESALTAEALGSSEGGPPVVLETVYAPVETPLIKAARRAGCRVVSGRAMFVQQALDQARLWTGIALKSLNTSAIFDDF